MPLQTPAEKSSISLSNLVLIASLTGACIGLYSQKEKINDQTINIEKQRGELGKLRKENHVLRIQNSRFKIKDIGLVHIQAVPSLDEFTWAWWIFIPKGFSYSFHVATKGVKCAGFPKRYRKYFGTLTGKPYLYQISVRKGIDGKWKMVQQTAFGPQSEDLSAAAAIWIRSKWSWQTGRRDAKEIEPKGKTELLRVLGGTPDAANLGFQVWIECQKK